MAKRSKKIDGNQGVFGFDEKLARYEAARADVLAACDDAGAPRSFDTRAEACIEIAAAVKRAIRHTGLSREEVVDQINEYFGDRRLSLHMFNHYLSKPAQYPLPAYLIFALLEITGSLEIAQALVDPIEARVISREEVRLMNLGKLDQTISEMQRLKKTLKEAR